MKLAQNVIKALKEAGENVDGFIKVKFEATDNNKAHLEKLQQQNAKNGIKLEMGEGSATFTGSVQYLHEVEHYLDPKNYTLELSYSDKG